MSFRATPSKMENHSNVKSSKRPWVQPMIAQNCHQPLPFHRLSQGHYVKSKDPNTPLVQQILAPHNDDGDSSESIIEELRSFWTSHFTDQVNPLPHPTPKFTFLKSPWVSLICEEKKNIWLIFSLSLLWSRNGNVNSAIFIDSIHSRWIPKSHTMRSTKWLKKKIL
jgi:hypothetical protein